jgi:23S rRNA pseudouridine1911/1915/1917 synthase
VETRTFDVDRASAGTRLDRWLAAAVPEQSRAKIQALIEDGRVRVDGAAAKASHRLRGGERVVIEIPPPRRRRSSPRRSRSPWSTRTRTCW